MALLPEVSSLCPATVCPVAAWMEEGRSILTLPSAQGALRGLGPAGQAEELSGHTLSFHAAVLLTRVDGKEGEEPVRWRGPGWGEGSAVGILSARLGSAMVREQQRFCLPPHRSSANPLRCSSKLCLKLGAAAAPVTFPVTFPVTLPGCLWRGGPASRSSLLAAAALAARQGRLRWQRRSGARSLSTVTLNSGLSLC